MSSSAVWWVTGTVGIVSFIVILALLIIIQSRLNQEHLGLRRKHEQLRFLIWVCVVFTILWLGSFATMLVYIASYCARPVGGQAPGSVPSSSAAQPKSAMAATPNTMVRLQRAFEADDYSDIADIIDNMPSVGFNDACQFRSYTTTPNNVKSVSFANL